MIEFYIIKNYCKNNELCEECVFIDYGGCFWQRGADPAHWNMDELQKAYDQLWKEDKTAEVFYKQLTDRMLDVMGLKKDGDTDEANKN